MRRNIVLRIGSFRLPYNPLDKQSRQRYRAVEFYIPCFPDCLSPILFLVLFYISLLPSVCVETCFSAYCVGADKYVNIFLYCDEHFG